MVSKYKFKKKLYTWEKFFQSLIPMWNHHIKSGRKYEVKVLDTKDKFTIQKKVIMIRRFLNMPVEECDIKIHDERTVKKRHNINDFSKASIERHFKKIDQKDD